MIAHSNSEWKQKWIIAYSKLLTWHYTNPYYALVKIVIYTSTGLLFFLSAELQNDIEKFNKKHVYIKDWILCPLEIGC